MSGDDDRAIRALIEGYSDAVFRRDAADWGACWAEDGRWFLMGAEVSGRANIVALWEQAMAGFAFVAFFSQVGQIAVEGDHATGRVWTHEVLEDGDGKITRPVGRYDDMYVRTAQGWRFAERRYTMLKG
jgi:uncharacterized protein (TIGR02246 family)